MSQQLKEKINNILAQQKMFLTKEEKERIEIADFGLDDLYTSGLQLLTYINTDRYCAKELILFPGQTCPEHKHPHRENGQKGKEETFRCRSGIVYLYVEGEPTAHPKTEPPKLNKEYYTVFKEIVLTAGEQHTIPPNTLHWFQAGAYGAIVSEFSSNSDDRSDVFTDPNIKR